MRAVSEFRHQVVSCSVLEKRVGDVTVQINAEIYRISQEVVQLCKGGTIDLHKLLQRVQEY